MSARDDYPALERAATARQLYTQAEKDEMARALDEIDRLRAELAGLRTVMSGWLR